MGKTLFSSLKTAAAIGLIVVSFPFDTKALVVECAGCVAASNGTTTAVDAATSELTAIKAELAIIKNYLNAIKLSLGSFSTTATVGSLGQSPDILNFAQYGPRLDQIDFGKGVELKLDSLPDLSKTLNSTLGIVNDAKRLKEAVKTGRFLVSAKEVAAIARRRQDLLRSSVSRVLETGVYTLGQTSAAKTRELSLDRTRRQAGDMQEKGAALMKQNQELLSRMNTLIVLLAEQSTLAGAKELQQMPGPRGPELEGSTPPPPKQQNAPWGLQ